MCILLRFAIRSIFAVTFPPFASQASAIAIDFNALIAGGTDRDIKVTGTHVTAGISNGGTITGTFIYENHITNASSSNISINVSEFVFTGAPFGASISIDSGYSFTSGVNLTVEVQNNKFIDASGVIGHVTAGTYDVVGLFGLTGSDEEWTINILGDTSGFTDASVIPASLPGNYDVFLQADEYERLDSVLAQYSPPLIRIRYPYQLYPYQPLYGSSGLV